MCYQSKDVSIGKAFFFSPILYNKYSHHGCGFADVDIEVFKVKGRVAIARDLAVGLYYLFDFHIDEVVE